MLNGIHEYFQWLESLQGLINSLHQGLVRTREGG